MHTHPCPSKNTHAQIVTTHTVQLISMCSQTSHSGLCTSCATSREVAATARTWADPCDSTQRGTSQTLGKAARRRPDAWPGRRTRSGRDTTLECQPAAAAGARCSADTSGNQNIETLILVMKWATHLGIEPVKGGPQVCKKDLIDPSAGGNQHMLPYITTTTTTTSTTTSSY